MILLAVKRKVAWSHVEDDLRTFEQIVFHVQKKGRTPNLPTHLPILPQSADQVPWCFAWTGMVDPHHRKTQAERAETPTSPRIAV